MRPCSRVPPARTSGWPSSGCTCTYERVRAQHALTHTGASRIHERTLTRIHGRADERALTLTLRQQRITRAQRAAQTRGGYTRAAQPSHQLGGAGAQVEHGWRTSGGGGIGTRDRGGGSTGLHRRESALPSPDADTRPSQALHRRSRMDRGALHAQTPRFGLVILSTRGQCA
jgi:hypothetical protein